MLGWENEEKEVGDRAEVGDDAENVDESSSLSAALVMDTERVPATRCSLLGRGSTMAARKRRRSAGTRPECCIMAVVGEDGEGE